MMPSGKSCTVESTHPETEGRSITVGICPVKGHPLGLFTGYVDADDVGVASPWIALTTDQARELAAELLAAAEAATSPVTSDSRRWPPASAAREALETMAIAGGPEALDWAVASALRQRGSEFNQFAQEEAIGEHLQLLAVREKFERWGGRWAR